MMKQGLYIILEQPRPKPGAQRLRPDTYSVSSIISGSDNTNNDEATNTSVLTPSTTTNNTLHKISQKCKRLHKPGESELIPEPFKSELQSAVADAESNDASSYVADHLCYMDEDDPYLALAGRTVSDDDYFFPIEKEGNDWRWLDHEDTRGPKLKPFEQY